VGQRGQRASSDTYRFERVRQEKGGFLNYCQSGLTLPRLDAAELSKRLLEGSAAFYLDGLDEIFDRSIRNSVVEEIAILRRNTRGRDFGNFSQGGYQPERLHSASFVHATIEDFDQEQMLAFLRLWYQIAEDNEDKRRQLTDRLIRAISDSVAIRELAGNPLLLTMMLS